MRQYIYKLCRPYGSYNNTKNMFTAPVQSEGPQSQPYDFPALERNALLALPEHHPLQIRAFALNDPSSRRSLHSAFRLCCRPPDHPRSVGCPASDRAPSRSVPRAYSLVQLVSAPSAVRETCRHGGRRRHPSIGPMTRTTPHSKSSSK